MTTQLQQAKEALEANEQCINDFIELYKRGCANTVMDEAVKSLRDDALKSTRNALAALAIVSSDAQPVASVVPEGSVPVPIVPTEAMCAAGNDASARYVRDAGDIYRAMLSAAPAPSVSEAQSREALSGFLVTLLISVDQKHNVYSDVQTHDNSFAEVAAGFSVIKAEIDRVFAERKSCPYYPIDRAAAKRKIMRKEQAAHPLAGLYINQGSMDAAADAYAAEYDAKPESGSKDAKE